MLSENARGVLATSYYLKQTLKELEDDILCESEGGDPHKNLSQSSLSLDSVPDTRPNEDTRELDQPCVVLGFHLVTHQHGTEV